MRGKRLRAPFITGLGGRRPPAPQASSPLIKVQFRPEAARGPAARDAPRGRTGAGGAVDSPLTRSSCPPPFPTQQEVRGHPTRPLPPPGSGRCAEWLIVKTCDPAAPPAWHVSWVMNSRPEMPARSSGKGRGRPSQTRSGPLHLPALMPRFTVLLRLRGGFRAPAPPPPARKAQGPLGAGIRGQETTGGRA